MIFRKYLPPVHIHPVLLLFIVISIITGTFMELTIIFTIVIIHEMGHYLMAKVFRWRIRKVMLWVFGGVMETDEHGNRSIKEDLLVTIAGPAQHFLIYLLFIILLEAGIITDPIYNMAVTYNTTILLFNLLPIWPLDGGKIIFILLSAKLPYRKSFNITLVLSMVFTVILFAAHFIFYSFTMSFAAVMIFLFIENRLEWKRRFFTFLRFLLRRYEEGHTVRKIESIYISKNETLMEVFSRFKREKKHTIFVQNKDGTRKQVDEADCLHAYFYEKQHSQKILDIT